MTQVRYIYHIRFLHIVKLNITLLDILYIFKIYISSFILDHESIEDDLTAVSIEDPDDAQNYSEAAADDSSGKLYCICLLSKTLDVKQSAI